VSLAAVIGVLNVFFALLVAVVPLFYPGYAFYYRQAQAGIQSLNTFTDRATVTVNDSVETVELSWINKNERGFKQIEKVVEREGEKLNLWFAGRSGEIERIGFIHGSTGALAVYFDDQSMRYGRGPNYALFAEYINGEREVVFYDAWRPEAGIKHTQLRSRIRSILERRSQMATAALAVMWTAVAVTNVAVS